MKALGMARSGLGISRVALLLVGGLAWASTAVAGPVVREAAGADAASIQAAVDAFRNDVGNPNNGNAVGTQPAGRREINWDGGGAASPPSLDGIPNLRFAARGAAFLTPGSGFEISGAPNAEFGDLNPTYPTIFASFSAPRIFTALNSNVTDAVFFVPGNQAIAAATTGFGVVFTDVDTASSTKMEFYAPDGTLLFERNVLPWAGSESLSFLGVSFDAGELIGRVRIISGNAALGPDETGTLDLVAMDDFIYGEPVATAGLTITPGSTKLFRTGAFDVVLGTQGLAGGITSGTVKLDGLDVTGAFLACLRFGSIPGGGQTLRCAIPRGLLAPGDHTFAVELGLSNQTRVRNSVRWTVLANTEP